MTVPTRAQDRVADGLTASPRVVRSSVVPVANNAIEVWLYGRDGVLIEIATVTPSGTYTSRPGVRVTDDTYIGYPEDRPEDPGLTFTRRTDDRPR